jgi:hypothetical protein
MSDELERKEVVVAKLRYYPGVYFEGMRNP